MSEQSAKYNLPGSKEPGGLYKYFDDCALARHGSEVVGGESALLAFVRHSQFGRRSIAEGE